MTKTAAQRWNDSILLYRKKCQNILKISKSIRYVGVINVYGRTLTGIIKKGVNPMLRKDQAQNDFFIISTLLSMRKPHYSSVGELEVAIVRHNKVTLLIFQRKDITYYISVDRKIRSEKLDQTILKIKKVI